MAESLRFSSLRLIDLDSDHFNYHLQQLVKKGIVIKNGKGVYELSNKGKALVAKLDWIKLIFKHQSKIHLVPICHRIQNRKDFYLIHLRKKQPFHGYIGLPSMKADDNTFFSENIINKLKKEAGFTGIPELRLIRHILVKVTGKDKIFEDKTFYFFAIKNLCGKLREKNTDGENYWMTLKQIKSIEKRFLHVIRDCKLFKKEEIGFEEEVQIYENL